MKDSGCRYCGYDPEVKRETYKFSLKFWQYVCLVCAHCEGYWALIPEVWWTDCEEPWPTTMTDEEYWDKYCVIAMEGG